jgi:hypothetical protein
MSNQVWTVAHEHGVTEVRVGDQFRAKYDPPDELWEVAGPSTETIESSYGDGECPVFPCRQIGGDSSLYATDREADGTINMCGDYIAEALYLAAKESPS